MWLLLFKFLSQVLGFFSSCLFLSSDLWEFLLFFSLWWTLRYSDGKSFNKFYDVDLFRIEIVFFFSR